MTSVWFRADASSDLGTGHVMRCATLADALRERGAETGFLCRDVKGNLISWLQAKGHRVEVLADPEDWGADARQTSTFLDRVGPIDWLVVDHYALDARWEKALRPHVQRLMVIDDLANRPHSCDLLLDQNLCEAADARYEGLLNEDCERLLGPRYALLRPEFVEQRPDATSRDGQVRRLLISFGGSDPTGETIKALEALRLLPPIPTDVLIGPANPWRRQIEELASHLPLVTCRPPSDRVADLMVQADLCLGSGGSTNWERCCLGLPGLVITVAANQEEATRVLAESGAILSLGPSAHVTPERLATALSVAASTPSLLRHMASVGQTLVDGCGTERVALTMLNRDVTVRLAMASDADLLYRWRNAPETRLASFTTASIGWDEHVTWLKASLQNPQRTILIGELEGCPFGVLRYDVEGTTATTSVYLDPDRHGQGLGSRLIRVGSRWMHRQNPHLESLRAEIRADNTASRNAFQAAGYKEARSIYEQSLRSLTG